MRFYFLAMAMPMPPSAVLLPEAKGAEFIRTGTSGMPLYCSNMIDPDLLKAFQTTRFIVFTPQTEIVMRIGERSSELDELMTRCDPPSCAFVTAWNPGSKRLPETANQAKQSQLIQEVQKRGYVFLQGRGVGETAGWGT
jgi:Protein of unknown function (DUF3293)